MRPFGRLDAGIPFVADASVAINLNATGCGERLLRSFPHRFHMADITLSELDVDRRSGRNDAAMIAKLISQGLVVIDSLNEVGLGHFEQLVVGRAQETLDDGEAASIALGLQLKGVVLIDERKGLRICAERFSGLVAGMSIDFLADPILRDAIGVAELAEAVFGALQAARMRVLPAHIEWLIGLLGQERVQRCPSVAHLLLAKSA